MKIQPEYISLVIPTYNENRNIIPLIRKITSVLSAIPHEMIIVDDGSPDGTADTVRRYIKSHRRVRLISHPPPRELGGSILLGMLQARGTIVIGMDADGNHEPAVIPELLYALRSADLVVASRFVKGGGMEDRIRYFASFWFNALLRMCFGFPIRDNTSGFYAMRKTTLRSMDMYAIYKGYGEYFIRLIYNAYMRGLRIHEVPVYYRNRVSGKSKSKLFTMIKTYLHSAHELRQQYQ